MSKKWLTLFIVAALTAGGYWAYKGIMARRAAATASTMETALVQHGDLAVTVEATGSLVPRAEVSLAFTSGGRVAEVLVEEGQLVEAGQPLAQLETDELALQVAQAEASLAQAQAQLAQIRVGPRPEDVAAAEAAWRIAQGNYEQLVAGPRPEEIAVQEANLRAMESQLGASAANLAQIQTGAGAGQIAAVEAQVVSAEAQQKIALDAHDRTMECHTVTQPDGTKKEVCPGLGTREEEARANLEAADAALNAAQVQLDELLAGPDINLVWAGQANVGTTSAQRDAVQAQIDLLLADPTEAQLQIMQAQVDQAQAQLEKLRHGPTLEEVAVAQAQVDQARTLLEQAQLRLGHAVLAAPMAGVVTTLHIQPGEMVGAGQPVVVLSDLAVLEVEVNLDETDVARLDVGYPAFITLDTFPGVEIGGRVESIAPAAIVQSGIVLYRVTVEMDPADLPLLGSDPVDLPLRSGMTVNVTFLIEQRSDALFVPFRAVETEGGQAYVTQVTASGSERVAVTMGLITDTQVEILSGLKEGDVVAVYANPVQDTELMTNPMFGGGQ